MFKNWANQDLQFLNCKWNCVHMSNVNTSGKTGHYISTCIYNLSALKDDDGMTLSHMIFNLCCILGRNKRTDYYYIIWQLTRHLLSGSMCSLRAATDIPHFISLRANSTPESHPFIQHIKWFQKVFRSIPTGLTLMDGVSTISNPAMAQQILGGLSLPRKDWVLLNCFRAGGGRCNYWKSK